MRSSRTLGALAVVGFGLLPALDAVAAPRAPAAAGQLATQLPQDLEVELALSALPPHLRPQATIHVLDPAKGFTVFRAGTNGFHTFVARTGDDTFRGTWPLTSYRDDILYPVAFDEAGARAQMRIFFDAAKLQAQGMAPDELKRVMRQRYAGAHYKEPQRAGISYMLSPILRTFGDPDRGDQAVTVNYPHVMYYAPHVADRDIGSDARGGMYPHVNLHGPHGYINQPLGMAERAQLNLEYKDMLARLCALKVEWCLPAS